MNDSRLELVIFDLDGVLVDTQDAEDGSLAHVGTLMGVHLAYAEMKSLFAGKRMQECLDILEDRAGSPPPPNAMAIARAKCEELIGADFEPIADVPYVLDRIPTLKSVASNGPRDIIERRLRASGIAHHFGDRLYSAYDVEAWKPDPKLFLWAAQECDVDVSRCLVIEDSTVGVDAALAANMPVLQYTAHSVTRPHRDGVETFSHMRELPDLVNGLVEGDKR